MKKIAVIFMIGLLFTSTLLSAQDYENKKLSYSIFNEYGYYFSPMSMPLNNSDYGGILAGFTTTVVNNLTLNKNMHFGLGLGFEFDSDGGMNAPLFFNFRNYFGNSNNKFRPMVNAAIGMRICAGEERGYIYTWNEYFGAWESYVTNFDVTRVGAYATFGGGFRAGAFSFHAAYFLKSGINVFSMGLEMKVGLVF